MAELQILIEANMNDIRDKIIAMVHLDALPGTPKYEDDVKKIIRKATEEAGIYYSKGIRKIMIENMHDVPYLNREAGHEISTIMTLVLYEILAKYPVETGLQILAGANKAAIAAANSAGASFIRAEGFVFSHIADEGIMNSDAGELLRYRKQIGADRVKVFTDIKKKHSSHALTSDVSIAETARAAEFFLSDGVIITGEATGIEPSLDEILSIRGKINIPVLAGSGITARNAAKYFPHIDAAIIGSDFKIDGKWYNPVDPARVENFIKTAM